MGKKIFKEAFSDEPLMDFWEDVYQRQDSYGMSVVQRLNLALSWLEKCKLSGNAIILDAGCGAGDAIYNIAQKGYRFVGMDYSYGMIQKAIKKFNPKNKPSIFLQGDIESLPFKDSSFNAIVCLGVLTYLNNEEGALRELSRILKPEGHLIIDVVNRARIISRLDVPILIKHRFQQSYNKRRSYLIPKIKKSLKRNGFSILEYKTIPHGGFKLFDRDMLPAKFNYNVSMFLEKFLNIPFVDTIGGRCVFRNKRTTSGNLE